MTLIEMFVVRVLDMIESSWGEAVVEEGVIKHG